MSEAQQQQRYRVIERLAAGGMAEVFLAESAGIEGFKKQVAIKRVLPHLGEKKRFMAMFLDEARLSAQLSHSNVVQVFDIGVGDHTYFIVMEYVDGADLKAVTEHLRSTSRPFPLETAIAIAIQICEGLAYAHERTDADGKPLHTVHRDVSPPNVLISKHGEVKLADFGLAKASTQLTKSEAGIIKGKFNYLSPEAAHGEEVDQRADIFAGGIILWEMLAGRRLFQGKSDYETVKNVQRAEVTPISQLNEEATPELESILARALARDRDRRYQSARALAQDLTRCLFRMGRPVSAFDVAELVRGAMLVRKSERPETTSIIDKLIQETLFEFTSLTENEQSASLPRLSPAPFGLGDLEGFGGWTEEGTDRPSTLLVRRTLPSGVFEEGNLAALEGPEERLPPRDSERSLPPSSRPHSVPDPAVAATEPSPAPPAPPSSSPWLPDAAEDRPSEPLPLESRASATPSEPAEQRARKARGVQWVLVVLILIGLAAVAYFSGLW